MMRRFFPVLVALSLSVSLGPGLAQDSAANSANALFVEAVRTYRDGTSLSGESRQLAMDKVTALFEQITRDFPKSRPADAVRSKSVPGVDFSDLGLDAPAEAALAAPAIPDLAPGLYTIDPALCRVSESVGAAWGQLFQEIGPSEVRRDRDRKCQVVSATRENGLTQITADCEVNGGTEPESWQWSIAPDGGFVETSGRNAGLTFRPCAEPQEQTTTEIATASPPQAGNAGRWGPDIVVAPSIELQYNLCRDRDIRACLTELGVGAAAIDFALAFDPRNDGSSVARSYRELGAVDLVRVPVIYAPYEVSVVVNAGPQDLLVPPQTPDLGASFRDPTSAKLLRRFPNASNIYAGITGHRLMPDGTQRFILTETLFDGCRACPTVGTGFSFLDIGAEGRIQRTPVGLIADPAGAAPALSETTLRDQPAALQRRLNALGYDAGEMDGYPGPKTRDALMAFQVEHCLPPTGQPNPASLTALVGADGISAPCAGTMLPAGVSANTPLLAGIYVDNMAYCDTESVPWEIQHLSQRIVRGTWITFGAEAGCTVARSDIRDGVTLFRGSCAEGNQSSDARWRFDVRAPDSFIDLGFEGQTASARAFAKCPDDSLLRQTWASWFRDFPVQAQTASTVTPPETPSRPAEAAPAVEAEPAAAVDIAELSTAQLAALLRVHGVAPENTSPNAPGVDMASVETEIAGAIARYKLNPPMLRSPEMPVHISSFDPGAGEIAICAAEMLLFSEAGLGQAANSGRGSPALKFLPTDPQTALGGLPRLCARGNRAAVQRIEAEFGTGTFERYGIDRGGGLALVLASDEATAGLLQASADRGEARVIYECRMAYRQHNFPTPSPYDYDRIGTCEIARIHIAAYDRTGGVVHRTSFDGRGKVFQAMGRLETAALDAKGPEASSPASEPVERLPRSFDTSDTGEAAIRALVEDFVGGPVEVILGYQNAFPFQNAPEKKLANAVFAALPEDEVATVAGTKRGYGSHILKQWSALNRYYFADEPVPGVALAAVGRVEDLRILSLRELTGGSCEWSVTYRVWLTDQTPFGEAVEQATATDGLTFQTCFRATRTGYAIDRHELVE